MREFMLLYGFYRKKPTSKWSVMFLFIAYGHWKDGTFDRVVW